MLKEFKEFAMRGNVIDMAVGVIIGGAFGKIITSFVNDVLMPPIGLLVSKVNFSDLCFDLQRHCFTTLPEAKTAGTATINIGAFINSVIDFTIIAFVIFMMVQVVHKIRIKSCPPAEVPAAPKTKQCPYCCSVIPLQAVRCPQCTSNLPISAG